MRSKALKVVIPALAALITTDASLSVAQQKDISVRVNRWIAVQQLLGNVSYDRTSGSRPARAGDRIETPGDGVTTDKKSSTTLQVDTGIGQINVLEQTQLRLRQLFTVPQTDARITRLQVKRGQVRLKLRRFTNPGSSLEIETPAGLSGVRGTEFGLSVQQDGKTNVAVSEGGVLTSAQGVEVLVSEGFQNFTIPGEAPSQPVALRDDTGLDFTFERIVQAGVRRIRLVGQVDPVNTVLVDGQPRPVDRTGRFVSDLYFAPSYPRVNVVVTTPLGKTQTYEVAFR